MWLELNKLKNLDIHTKKLINQGIYTLYSCKENTKYLLKISDHEFYFLDLIGNIIDSSRTKPNIEITNNILFKDLKIPLNIQINIV